MTDAVDDTECPVRRVRPHVQFPWYLYARFWRGASLQRPVKVAIVQEMM